MLSSKINIMYRGKDTAGKHGRTYRLPFPSSIGHDFKRLLIINYHRHYYQFIEKKLLADKIPESIESGTSPGNNNGSVVIRRDC